LLVSSEGSEKTCPLCGNPATVTKGRVYFTDRQVLEMRLIVNDSGIFVRGDEVLRRDLRAPIGAFRPILVELDVASC
jgi:hypothetical protein